MRKLICTLTAFFILSVAFTQTITPLGNITFCEGGGVMLTVSSDTSITAYQWMKDGTAIPNEISVNYTATALGNYTVRVKRDTLFDTIGPVKVTVYPKPTVNVNSPSVCVGETTTLIATGANTYAWSPSTALSSTTGATVTTNTNVTTTYRVIGMNSSGCLDTAFATVTVNQKPITDFTFTDNACSGANVAFTPTASGGTPGYTYSWDFGDGVISTNPSHIFTSLGCSTFPFNVKLTVTDSKGCTNNITKLITIKQAPDVQIKDQDLFYPFSNCHNSPTRENPNYTLTILNNSPNANCITSYSINWGDGSTPENNITFPLTHTYPRLGAYNLVISCTGSNGCNNSKTYLIANQSNPGAGFGTVPNTTTGLCAPSVVPLLISDWQDNSPGTIYFLNFGDGKSITLTHPLKNTPSTDTINYTYETSSCPNPTFTATLDIVNACSLTPYSAGNIQVRIKPLASFSIPTEVCVGQNICFTNNSTLGTSGNNCSNTTAYIWNFGDNSPTNHSENPCHTYASPGIYNVILTSANPCGTTTSMHEICVTAPPSPDFTLSTTAGCAPFTTTATNATNTFNSCQNPKYFWTISSYNTTFCGSGSVWDFAPGSFANSINPSFIFTNPGTYTITQNVINACGTFTTTKTVKVKKPPKASIIIPAHSCGTVNITPVAVTEACTDSTLTYAWTFAGGTPATANTANPGNITFSTPGTHLITLSVTNECGTTTDTDSVVVSTLPDVAAPPDLSLCGGLTAGPYNFTSTFGATTYKWTNSNPSIGLAGNGIGSIPAFTAINTGSAPQVATIIVTPNVSSCIGTPDTFTITVNPRPTAPAVTTPVTYCQNATAATLTATATGTDTLIWYNNALLTGGTSAAPTPSTSTPGTKLYYVTQTNSFNCLSASSPITINVNPVISGNIIANDQNICANTSPKSFTSGTISGGNNAYAYQWQSLSKGSSVWANIQGANSSTYSPGVLNDTIQYRRIVTSATCSDTSNIVTINVAGALSNFNISLDQTICEGVTPAVLNGELPTGGGGGYNYVWEQSTDGNSWRATGGNTQNYQPPALTVTTFYRRKVNAAQCSATSDIVTITVNPTPVASIAAISNSICVYDNGIVRFNATTGTAPYFIELAVTKPGASIDTITQTINNNRPADITVIPANSPAGSYTIELIKLTDSKNCERINISPAGTITVKPLPVLILTNSSPICNGVSATLTASGADTYSWSPNQFINTTLGSTVSVSPPATFTYFVRGTLNGCFKDTSTSVTVIPGAVVSNAGPDQVLCNVTTTNLAANAPSVNSTGAWSQVIGPSATIATDQNNTTVSGLTARGTYFFRWTITGQAPCPPTTDDVTIDILSPIINTIKNDTIICNGQSLTISNESLSGGSSEAIDSFYSYQWESSPAGKNNWQNITGANDATLLVSPVVSTCYRRNVKTNDRCETISNAVCVTVNPTITNNIITADQEPCVNTPVTNLQGSIPAGGDNIYEYQWQTSNDSIVWNNVAATISYQPPSYTIAGTHYFRRNVTGGNCTSVSNIVIVRVRPDAKAIFTSNPTTNCSAFDLSKAITVTALPDSNATYNWYADGAFFGSNTSGIFPGYTITNPDDTVIIKLVTNSKFGCQPDSTEQQFITVKTAVANFTKDKVSGCGPLNVTFNNTSNIINSNIQFFWNFGNGITRTDAQPGTITFLQSPFFNDTTYQITLKAFNGCDTTIWRDSVKIRSNPKARFGLDNTSGCSPFTVNLTNTSLGGTNTYYWDFGNGHKDTTRTNGVLNYTYNIGNVADTFPVRLIAINECAADTQVINVRVAPNSIKPQITINGSELFGCAPHIVTFNNATTGATSFTWDYGDGSSPDITNNRQSTVVHKFDKPGIFTIAIRMSNGCSDTTAFRQVTVFANPIADFTTNASVYCLGDTIRVNNKSLNANNYRWFWGDGQSTSGSDTIHVYTIAGNHTILLRAEKINNFGVVCSDTLVQNITMLTKPDVRVQTNIANINCTPFTLNATAPGIINESVTWYISDTAVSSSLIIKPGVSTQYIFNKAGTFSIKMVAVNAAGCRDSSVRTFTVRGTPDASFAPLNISACKTDTTISYLNTTALNDNDPLSYKWLVNGVQQKTDGNFTFRYIAPVSTILPVTFNTQLIATNSVGCSDTAGGILQLNPVARAQFSINNPNTCVPFIASVANASQYTTKYKWLLNGVLTDTVANPTLRINQPSTPYTITLIADNIYGCKPDTFSISFTSRIKPKATFALNDTLGCTGFLNVVTINQSTNANSYQWDWGDNSVISSLTSPTHLYTFTGRYLITIVASDGVCKDTANTYVTVATKPIVDFSADDTLTCDTARVQFTNLTRNSDRYLWSFSDGTFSTETDPLKNFTPSDLRYTVKLLAGNSAGCKDSLIKPNLILAKVPPASDFLITPAPAISVPDYTFSFNNLTLNSNKYNYQWSLGDGAFASTRDVTHKYADTGNYFVRLIVLDTSTNCPDTTIKIARIDGYPGYLFVPNAFYPNSIRTEFKTFKPMGKGLEDYHLQIFDSWGKLLFETRELDAAGSPAKGWDGTYNGMPVPQDSYAWRITAYFKSGKKWDGMSYSKSGGKAGNTFGTLTLFR